MNLSKRFGSNTNKETNGIKLKLDSKSSITIKRAGGSNKEYMIAMAKYAKENKRETDDVEWMLGEGRIGLSRLFADHIVVAWDNILVGNDELLPPFTPDTCFKVFCDYPDFFYFIQDEASKIANYQDETDAKN